MCPGEETVAAYVAGHLARAERDELDRHLDACAACQELVAALAKVASPREVATGSPFVALEPGDAAREIAGGQLGRYVLLARLGAGGMGVVYAAYDPELDRRVAVKVLRRTRAGELLRDEARAIARLAHPNVIAVHDVGEVDGEVFVAMEHVDGVTLRDWLRTPRTPAAILDVFVQAGRGLAAAHRAGLVHRDVKPSNIIVGSDGRARVLDFGLARDGDAEHEVAGTPAYMAPEQTRGERVDARADQYAFAVALAEALGTHDPGERVARAVARARSERAEDRFATLDELLAALAPPPPRSGRWVATASIAIAALAGAVIVIAARERPAAPSCAHAADAIAAAWGPPEAAAVRAAFAATGLPFADAAARDTVAALDAWAARWRAQATATCNATVVERVQPAATHALRTSCLDQLVVQLRPVVAIARAPDAEVIARGAALATSLPAPERCADVAALGALPPPAERDRAELAALRTRIAADEAALTAGRAAQVRADVLAIRDRAAQLGYLPLQARAQLLAGRLEVSAAHYTEGIAALHAAARTATAARDLETLAEAWIELAQALGNDLRTTDEADVFDGYAEALIAQLPAEVRADRGLQLALARCNRNVTAAQAAAIAAHCASAIALAEHATPPRSRVANAARTRLGHFQRLQGKPAEGLVTLRAAVAEAIALHGPAHPDVAIAQHALGLALVAQDDVAGGIPALESALAIREAAFPGGNLQVAESLITLGDALGASGQPAAAIARLDAALAMLAAIDQGASAHAVNAHMLAGMTLEELARPDAALAHYVRAADIADRSLQHRENLVAMGLRSAAGIEIARAQHAAAVPYLERAIRVLEAAKAAPADLGKTQFLLGQVLYALGARERARARALVLASRASLVTAGEPASAALAEVDAFLRAH